MRICVWAKWGLSMYETIDYRVDDGVALICLNRPQRHNAINDLMHRELPQVWQRFKSDPTAIVAIITGAGERAFCSGADIADLPSIDFALDAAGKDAVSAIRWTSQQNDVWKPVICAVNGMTVGGGLHFVADSDIVIAADTATFSDTHVQVGLVAGLEPVGLCRRMASEAVLRMALMGGCEKMSAQRAYELGMVSEIVAAPQLAARARQIADIIKRNSPSAMARTKKAIWQAKELPLRAAIENAWRLIGAQNAEHDFVEGTRAYLEKRPPVWAPYIDE